MHICFFLLVQSNTDTIRAYLDAVYPAISLKHAIDSEVIELFESLDYYYDVDPTRGASMRPPITFSNLSTSINEGLPPQLPYVPAGVWYNTQMRPSSSGKSKTVKIPSGCGSNYLRWANPVRIIAEPLRSPSRFHSSLGTTFGPQPSWTNVMAIVRFVWWPIGFSDVATPTLVGLNAFPQRSLESSARVMAWPLDDHSGGRLGGGGSRLSGLLGLRDGDFVEIERWGGPTAVAGGPSIWANIWRGTGVFMRVTSPFVTLHKSAAIVELLLELDARDPKVVLQFGERLRLGNQVLELRQRFVDATPGETLASVLLTSGLPEPSKGPCVVAGGWSSTLSGAYNQTEWLQAALLGRLHPRLVVDHFLLRGRFGEPGAYALYWLYGTCGRGPYPSSKLWWATWDGIIAKLACLLGVKTIVFAAAPNGNGLLHQEVLDLDAPSATSWPTILERGPGVRTNSIHSCFMRRDPSARELADHWQRVGKLQLRDPRQPNADAGMGTSTGSHLPCRLFGGERLWKHRGRPCFRYRPRVPVPHVAIGCHLWCKSAMSEVHSRVPAWAHMSMYSGTVV